MKRVELPKGGFNLKVKTKPGEGLSGRFMVPPFSVLRVTDSGWLDRRRQWLSLGIEGEKGRNENKKKCYGNIVEWANKKGDIKSSSSNERMSVFDPTLCEILYSWFCPKNGQVIDPFAGGSVRGIVAVYMGFKYWGCELRPEQVEENKKQAESITPDKPPVWICGNSEIELKNAPEAEFIFSCPPYGDLEVYSEINGDISNMNYENFLSHYRKIVRIACRKLKENRFACFVVSSFRDRKTGFYHNLTGDTVCAFEDSGAMFYNDIVFVTPVGSLPIRVGRQFEKSRKIGRSHQNVLVFYKGDTASMQFDGD